MILFTVTRADTSKNGKPRVYFDNRHGWKDAYYVSAKIAPPPVGAQIDAEVTSADFNGDGKQTWFLNSWKACAATSAAPIQAPAPAAAPVQPSLPIAAPATPAAATAPEFTFTEPELRFISNVVGQAILAKTITEPGHLSAWFGAAKALLFGADYPAPQQNSWSGTDTKLANKYAERINDAVREANDDKMMSIWSECKDPSSEDFECAVFSLLSGPVKNRIRDLESRQAETRFDADGIPF
jgi:hypothetical protein